LLDVHYRVASRAFNVAKSMCEGHAERLEHEEQESTDEDPNED